MPDPESMIVNTHRSPSWAIFRVIFPRSVTCTAFSSKWRKTFLRTFASVYRKAGPPPINSKATSTLEVAGGDTIPNTCFPRSFRWIISSLRLKTPPWSSRARSVISSIMTTALSIWIPACCIKDTLSSKISVANFASPGRVASLDRLDETMSSVHWSTWSGVRKWCSERLIKLSNILSERLVSSKRSLALASEIFRFVSSRMKHRVCSNLPLTSYLTLLSMSKSTTCPSFARNRTGTSLIVFPLPSCLKISKTISSSSGQNFIMGWPMYSSAVYPNTSSSLWLAHKTIPSPLSQCKAMGAFWKKSTSSQSLARCSMSWSVQGSPNKSTSPSELLPTVQSKCFLIGKPAPANVIISTLRALDLSVFPLLTASIAPSSNVRSWSPTVARALNFIPDILNICPMVFSNISLMCTATSVSGSRATIHNGPTER